MPELAADRVLKITWVAQIYDGFGLGLLDAVMLLLGHLGVSLRGTRMVFETYHAVSDTALRQLRFRRFCLRLCGLAAYALVILGVVLFLVAGASALLLLLPGATKGDRMTAFLLLGTATVFVGVGAWGRSWFAKLGVPEPLRGIGRWPVQVQSLQTEPLPSHLAPGLETKVL